MKVRAVVMWGVVGSVLSSAGAMAVPMKPMVHAPQPPPVVADLGPKADAVGPSHLNLGRTLLMDARLGHASLARGAAGETYLFTSVTSLGAATASAPPLDLAIVIDRSGSMKGQRMLNALIAAGSAVDRMRDGDSVIVVSFDTQAQVVVPHTFVSAATRPAIETAIQSIRLGGDTCISCGLEEARRQLDAQPRSTDRAARMLLLSDGATNNGIRDLAGLRAMAGRMRDRGFPISTIGVDVDFDERVMGALASESNGNHYFVSNPAGLTDVFNKEFDSLIATVARDAEVAIDLAPGVECEQVFDRTFRREGSRILVPLGNFSAKDEKSVLLKVKVAADRDGTLAVADVKLAYRDLLDRNDATFAGTLSVSVRGDGSAQQEMDPFVRARVERSATARTLNDANELMNQGRFQEARDKLLARQKDLEKAKTVTKADPHTAPPVRARNFKQDFDDQAAALDNANKSAGAAASAAPTSRLRKEAPKDLERELQSDPFR